MNTFILSFAILTLCMGHYCKVYRWRQFVKIYEEPNDKNLLQALSFGYLINFFLPFKVGDIFRAIYSGRKMKNKYTFALSTIIIDRILDVIVVGILFVFFNLLNGHSVIEPNDTLFYVVLSLVLLIVIFCAFRCRKLIKKIILLVSSVFNERIEFYLLTFSWSIIWNFKDIFTRINKMKLIISTLFMWGMYIFSYYLLARYISIFSNDFNITNVFNLLFSKNSFDMGTGSIAFSTQNLLLKLPHILSIYMLIPLLIILIASHFFHEKRDNQRVEDLDKEYLNLLPQTDRKERLNFLEFYFTDDRNDYIGNYLRINQNISVIKDFSAGSNATTMLCTAKDIFFFRKYAFGNDGDKLYQQIEWIQKHSDKLPLPEILKFEKNLNFCYYDMPNLSNSVGLFHYVHSMPSEQGWAIISAVFDKLESTIYEQNIRQADKDTIHKYISEKVQKNVEIIKKSKILKNLLSYEKVIINGKEYLNLNGYKKFLTEDYLISIFQHDIYSDIHGDLTIENIICTRNDMGKDEFYIIDPNTGNIHDSANLDYGKMLQSLHGGYEFLMSTQTININKNEIDFVFTKSSVYDYLHNKLFSYMLDHFGIEKTKSIYYHEIIHWLRLLPYKIEKDGVRAVLFYCGLIMVLNDVTEKFESENYEK